MSKSSGPILDERFNRKTVTTQRIHATPAVYMVTHRGGFCIKRNTHLYVDARRYSVNLVYYSEVTARNAAKRLNEVYETDAYSYTRVAPMVDWSPQVNT